MTDKLKQTIKEEVGKLPKGNQEVIDASNWEQMSEEIGKKYLLNENEVNNFQVETLLVLVGMVDPETYANNIENEVGTSKVEAEKIAKEVIEKIFIPINDKLIENLKKSGVIKNSKWDQNLNFILSGGDYSALISNEAPLLDKEGVGGGNKEEKKISPMLTPSLAEIRNNVQNPPERLVPSSRAGTKMTDIKK